VPSRTGGNNGSLRGSEKTVGGGRPGSQMATLNHERHTEGEREGNSAGRRDHSTDKTFDTGKIEVQNKRRHPLHGAVRRDDMETDERDQKTSWADDGGTTRSADDRRRKDSRRRKTEPNVQVLRNRPRHGETHDAGMPGTAPTENHDAADGREDLEQRTT
jgi:hypothetical protein